MKFVAEVSSSKSSSREPPWIASRIDGRLRGGAAGVLRREALDRAAERQVVQERTQVDGVHRTAILGPHRHRVGAGRDPLPSVSRYVRVDPRRQGAQQGALPVEATPAEQRHARFEGEPAHLARVRQVDGAARLRRREEGDHVVPDQRPVVVPRPAREARVVGHEGEPAPVRQLLLEGGVVLDRCDVGRDRSGVDSVDQRLPP